MKKMILALFTLTLLLGLLLIGGCASTPSGGNSASQAPQFTQTSTKLKPITTEIKVTNNDWKSSLNNYETTQTAFTTNSLPQKVNMEVNLTDNMLGGNFDSCLDVNQTYIYQSFKISIYKGTATITIYQPMDRQNNYYQYNQALNEKFLAILKSCMQGTPLPSQYYVTQNPTSSSSSNGALGTLQQTNDAASSVNNFLKAL